MGPELTQRRHLWETALPQAVQRHDVPFVWGQSDCFQLVADAVRAQIDPSPLEKLRGGYKSELTAMRRLREMGYKNLSSLMGSYFPKIPNLMARRGDIGVVYVNDAEHLAIVLGTEIIGKSADGLIWLNRQHLHLAYRVGF